MTEFDPNQPPDSEDDALTITGSKGVSMTKAGKIQMLHTELERYGHSTIMIGNGTEYAIASNIMADTYITMLEQILICCNKRV